MKAYLVLLIVMLLLASSISYTALANDDDEEEIEREIEELKEREGELERKVEVKREGNKIKIESKFEKEDITGAVENKFEVEFKTDEEVEIKLEYEEESETAEGEFETELEQEVEFDSVIEFVDSNNNGIYDKGEEVFIYKLDRKDFTVISYTTGITHNNVTEHVISTQTTDGVFKVVLHAIGEFANIENQLVKPTEVKIDLVINGFPYNNSNSKLALKTKIESSMEIETEKKTETGEEEIKIRSPSNFTGFFSWTKTALIDGVEREVKSTSLVEDPEEDSEELYLIYERGNFITHDPKIGFVSAVALPKIVSNLIYFIIVGIIVVAVAAFWSVIKRR